MARFNFPSRLPRETGGAAGVIKYPTNLIANNRNYYVTLSFSDYTPPSAEPSFFQPLTDLFSSIGSAYDAASDFAGTLPGVGTLRDYFSTEISETETQRIRNQAPTIRETILLPLPKKLNDNLVLSWSEKSLTDTVSSLTGVTRAAVNVARLQSAFSGVTVNPFLYLYFDRPNFKRYSFTWTLAPRNEQESLNINEIIKILKENSSPSVAGPLMLYPSTVELKFYPDDNFQRMKLKPCIIESVAVDYTPSGPSFLNATAAPTLINLTLNLKEIELWAKGDEF